MNTEPNEKARRLEVDIRVWREHFLRDHKLKEYSEINKGRCEEFAQFIIAKTPGAEMYGVEEFQTAEGGFDWELLRHQRLAAPQGFTENEVDSLDIGGHLWIIFERKHYDAECPKGVHSFFELPFFQRQLLKGLACQGSYERSAPTALGGVPAANRYPQSLQTPDGATEA